MQQFTGGQLIQSPLLVCLMFLYGVVQVQHVNSNNAAQEHADCGHLCRLETIAPFLYAFKGRASLKPSPPIHVGTKFGWTRQCHIEAAHGNADIFLLVCVCGQCSCLIPHNSLNSLSMRFVATLHVFLNCKVRVGAGGRLSAGGAAHPGLLQLPGCIRDAEISHLPLRLQALLQSQVQVAHIPTGFTLALA